MLRCNITFDQLSFTEEELKTKMIRVMVLYINDLYKLFEHDPDPGGADIIREWMQQHHITFDLLDFSEEELEAKKAMSLDRLH